MPRRPDALTAASEGACQWWGWLLAVREWSKGLAPERRTAIPCRWSVDFELPEADLYPRQGRHKRQLSGYVRKYGQLLTPPGDSPVMVSLTDPGRIAGLAAAIEALPMYTEGRPGCLAGGGTATIVL